MDDGVVGGEEFEVRLRSSSTSQGARENAEICTGVNQELNFRVPVEDEEAVRRRARSVGLHQRRPVSFPVP